MPLDRVHAAWLQPIARSLADQRDEIRALNLPSDLLVVFKQNGKSLDYVEGVVGEITDAEVEFTSDEKPMRVQRSKVAGVVYYRGRAPANSAPTCDPRGTRSAGSPRCARADGRRSTAVQHSRRMTAFTWPLADVFKADFSAGKLAFLSDLEPARQQWSPWIELPAGATLGGRVRSASSRRSGSTAARCRCGFPTTCRPGSGRAQTFDKGLSLRSRTEISYRLPSGFRRFLAIAGIEPTTKHRRRPAADDRRRRPATLERPRRGRPAAATHRSGNRRRQAVDDRGRLRRQPRHRRLAEPVQRENRQVSPRIESSYANGTVQLAPRESCV